MIRPRGRCVGGKHAICRNVSNVEPINIHPDPVMVTDCTGSFVEINIAQRACQSSMPIPLGLSSADYCIGSCFRVFHYQP